MFLKTYWCASSDSARGYTTPLVMPPFMTMSQYRFDGGVALLMALLSFAARRTLSGFSVLDHKARAGIMAGKNKNTTAEGDGMLVWQALAGVVAGHLAACAIGVAAGGALVFGLYRLLGVEERHDLRRAATGVGRRLARLRPGAGGTAERR